ncbi:hypothetical protein BKA69DRAFT_1043637 [Paraphysoderma sedebokerense]|nr:hypothetical protein BKA69DRAFT_1043637 [Paraphysoderma sedebokerense]
MQLSYTTALSTLRDLRTSGDRNPTLVSQCAEVVLKHPSSLGDEYWSIIEQYIYACLDLGKFHDAENYIRKLQNKFSKTSTRVLKLEGTFYEAKGAYEKANEIYNEILKNDKNNIAIYKRKIALLKSQNDIQGAINLLVQYVDYFPNDAESWLELADLYLSLNMYQQAAFSVEEAILLLPFNHLLHVKYGEILYTMGGADNIRIALKSFCRSLELCTDFLKGLYGVKMCIKFLSSTESSSSGSASTDLSELDRMITKRLHKVYEHSLSTVSTSEGKVKREGKDDNMILRVARAWLGN